MRKRGYTKNKEKGGVRIFRKGESVGRESYCRRGKYKLENE